MRTAKQLHAQVPPDWYFVSIRDNFLQKYWHERRFREVEKVIEPVNGGVVLDIGSADGVFSKVIFDRTKAKKLYGIDVLAASVSWANNHWKNFNMHFSVGDAHKLVFKDEMFDAVFALEVLEHVFSPKKVLSEVKRVLKKNGYAVFLVPTDSFLFKNIVWFMWTKFRGKIWKDTHIQSFVNGSLTDLCRRAGFKVEVERKFILGMLLLLKVRKL